PEIGCLQMDLMDISKYSKYNHGYKFLLNVVDVYSRYAWSVPLKSKGATGVVEALEDIVAEVKKKGDTDNVTFTSDFGKEFNNHKVKEAFPDVKHYVIDSSKSIDGHPTTTGIVEA